MLHFLHRSIVDDRRRENSTGSPFLRFEFEIDRIVEEIIDVSRLDDNCSDATLVGQASRTAPMRVEQVNFTSRNRVARAWSIKDRVSNSSGERKKERKENNKG